MSSAFFKAIRSADLDGVRSLLAAAPSLDRLRALLRAGLWALVVLAVTAGRAECVAVPARIVALDFQGCRPAAVAIEEQVVGSRVWWLRDYMISIAEQVPGVVLRGRVARWRQFEPPQTLGPWQRGGSEEEYFFASLDPEFCATFEPLDSILLVVARPCCDIIPPVDLACLLELPQARSPTPLERELAETVVTALGPAVQPRRAAARNRQ